MLNINLVFAPAIVTHSVVEPSDGLVLRRGDVRILCSSTPLPDCDLYAYQNAYSFFGRRAGLQVLVQGEPVVTQPGEFTCEVFGHFDHVLTLLEALDGITPEIERWQDAVYGTDGRPEPVPEYADLRASYPLEGRRDAICMVNGNKASAIPGQLYSARAEIARWFHDHSTIPFDVFGRPPFEDLPSYVGPLGPGEKQITLAKYRYSLCFENCYDPFWSRGYITLRLPECLATRTVPIYLGCSNVEDYVPANCFIDYREFGSSSRLNEYLLDISEATYHAYVRNIDQWLQAGNLHTYCRTHLYDKLTGLLAGSVGKTAAQLWGLDAGWTVVDTSDEPSSRRANGDGSPTASTEMHSVRYWTWSHLTLGSLEDCAASVDMMKQTQTLGAGVAYGGRSASEKPREVRRVLYLGVQSSYGDRPEELDYNIRNLLTEWDAWRDVEVHHIDPVARSLLMGTAGMSKEVLDRVLRGGFDTVFCVPFGPPFDVLHDVMRRITLHAKTVVWLPHKPHVFQTHSLPWASCVDRVVTTSDKDCRAFAEAGHGDRVTKSQWAFSPRTYRRVRVERAPVVTLVGQQNQVRAEACDYLAAHGVNIAAYGRGWGDGRFLTESGFQRNLSESAINLNLGGRRRVFETTGSGGFLMTTPVEGLEDAFITDDVDPDRAEVVVVNDTDELLHKARHYMEHPAAREAIARRGFRRAHAEHTWKHRFAAVFSESGWALPN